ncbi:hypothetical protein V5O48_016528, partial [Marasmius crinis-equi]
MNPHVTLLHSPPSTAGTQTANGKGHHGSTKSTGGNSGGKARPGGVRDSEGLSRGAPLPTGGRGVSHTGQQQGSDGNRTGRQQGTANNAGQNDGSTSIQGVFSGETKGGTTTKNHETTSQAPDPTEAPPPKGSGVLGVNTETEHLTTSQFTTKFLMIITQTDSNGFTSTLTSTTEIIGTTVVPDANFTETPNTNPDPNAATFNHNHKVFIGVTVASGAI